jgi:hypothetical protein
MPCNATELVHFRKRIGVKGFNLIFKMSVALHGKQAQESTVLIDHTHQARVMNRFCSYLWVVVLILVDKTRNLFDKFQTGCVWEVCVAIL